MSISFELLELVLSCTSISPAIFWRRAERTASAEGRLMKFTSISAPPLKSMPYFGPPLTNKLTKPAAVSSKDRMMNGHFLPRK